MTENEAIKELRDYRACSGTALPEEIETAIQALEEIQQYRTLEQKLQSVYGEHDGLLEIIVNGLVRYENAPDKAIKAVLLTDDDGEKWEQLKAIGTIEEFKALKEKSVAKQPDYEGDGCWDGHVVIDTWICPNCEKHYEVDYDDHDYCPNCGQHIDHSGLTEDD